MPQIDTSSDLLEVTFTPEERNRAMQLMDRDLSMMYLQQRKVTTFRQIVALKYTPEEIAASVSEHRYLTGRLDLLNELIQDALNPEPVPVSQSQPQ